MKFLMQALGNLFYLLLLILLFFLTYFRPHSHHATPSASLTFPVFNRWMLQHLAILGAPGQVPGMPSMNPRKPSAAVLRMPSAR